MHLAAEAAAAEEVVKNDPLLNDPWYGPTSRLKGRIDWDGREYITSQQCLDALEVPMPARNGAVFRRLTQLLREQGWEPIRIKLNGVDGGGVTERVRGYSRSTNKLPHPRISEQFPGKIGTSTPYVIGKIVSRLEMDSRWALARSIRALVAERDALKEKLDTWHCDTSDLPRHRTLGQTSKTITHGRNRSLLPQFRKRRLDPGECRGLAELGEYALCFSQMLNRKSRLFLGLVKQA